MFTSSDFVVIGMSMLALAGFIWYAVTIVVRQGDSSGRPAAAPRSGSPTDRQR
jgi:hypothetical protein